MLHWYVSIASRKTKDGLRGLKNEENEVTTTLYRSTEFHI